MSPEDLAERMEKIRLQNEKIKERREHVKADEEAFNTSIASDRARRAANRKVQDKIQAQINENREQNAQRKLEKMANREWDSGKRITRGGRGRGSTQTREGEPRTAVNEPVSSENGETQHAFEVTSAERMQTERMQRSDSTSRYYDSGSRLGWRVVGS
ncbi:hypothetical protein K439DRAFT_1413523 [Ramaria rubella]|nr:hypothetical protein K439DRAFT_1413523 [Ramaria rubella]